MSQKIIITIPSRGLSEGKKSVNVRAEGFVGTGCSLETNKYMKALGAAVDEQFLPEYYETENVVDTEISAD